MSYVQILAHLATSEWRSDAKVSTLKEILLYLTSNGLFAVDREFIYIYLYKHGQGLGHSGRLLGRFPGPGMRFCHFEGQIIVKFEIVFFPISWMGHLELHFRLFEGSRP